MKKKFSIFIILFGILNSPISTNAYSCFQGSGPCVGVCVGIYGSNSTPDSYKCDTGSTATPKNCTNSDSQSEFLP